MSGPASGRPQRGQEIELEVESLAYGGEGVARIGEQGYVVFVAGAIPGDRVRAHVYKSKRSYAHARTVELLAASPQRIEPLAQHPGVPWQVLPYERQLAVKQEQVAEALARIGGLSDVQLRPIVPALAQWRYRNKLEFSFGSAPDGRLLLGFHAPARWNTVVHIDDCLLASEAVNRARQAAYQWCAEQGLHAWERSAADQRRRNGARDAEIQRQELDRQRTGPQPDGRAALRNLVIREGRRSGKLQVRLISTEGEIEIASFAEALLAGVGADAFSGILWTRSRQLGETTGGGETQLAWGSEELHEVICGLDFSVPPEAFLQTNTEMAEVLYGVAADAAQLSGGERVFDLFSGIGTIALALAGGTFPGRSGQPARPDEVYGLEISEAAVAGARAAAQANGVSGVSFRAGDVRRGLADLVGQVGNPDVAIVDPPRAGLGRRTVEALIAAGPERIVYVSCNPTTLAADAAQLVAAGFALESVQPVDMFPQTHHIECVAALSRV